MRRLESVLTGLKNTSPGRRRLLVLHNGAFATPTCSLINLSHLREVFRDTTPKPALWTGHSPAM